MSPSPPTALYVLSLMNFETESVVYSALPMAFIVNVAGGALEGANTLWFQNAIDGAGIGSAAISEGTFSQGVGIPNSGPTASVTVGERSLTLPKSVFPSSIVNDFGGMYGEVSLSLSFTFEKSTLITGVRIFFGAITLWETMRPLSFVGIVVVIERTISFRAVVTDFSAVGAVLKMEGAFVT